MKRNLTNLKLALMASTVVMVPNAVTAQDGDIQGAEEITVTGRYIPNEKRSTSEIANVVDSGAFTQAGDSNIAAALTRLPGISADSTGKYVVIRGLSERYTSTLLNGTQLPSPDPLKNAVPLDIFPTSMIKSVLVQKTYSAEYPAAFGGGVIDIRTKAVPDAPFLKIGATVGYNTESTGKKGLSYYGSNKDWLGIDDGLRDIPTALDNDPLLENVTPEELEAIGEAIPNIWSIDSEPNYPDFDFNLSLGDTYEVGEGDLGIILAVDYGSQMRNRFGERYTYSQTNNGLDSDRIFGPEACEAVGVESTEDCGYRTTIWDIDLNAFGSVGYQFNADHSLKFTSLLLRSSQRQVEVQQGRTDSRDLANFTRLDWKEREVWSNSLFGEHLFNLGTEEDTEFDWFISKTDASRTVPLRKTYEYFFDEVDRVFRLSARTDGNAVIWGDLEDTSNDYGFSIKQPTYIADMPVDIKFGGAYNEKERVSEFRRYSFDLQNVTNRELREFIPEIIFGETNIDPNGIFLREFFDASDRFEADFESKAGYFQLDAQVTDTLRLSGGVRYEESTQTVSTVDRTTDQPILITQDLDKWLPSATLTWEFRENMQLRLGYSETVNRPDSRELSPARFVREDGRTEEGNPNLTPATIRNYDARYEWYVGKDQSVTFGAFYKEIDNPIEYTIKPIGDGQLDFIANADEATLKGLELEADFKIGTWMDREFFIKANGSYIDSEVTRTSADFGNITTPVGPMQGQSKWLANAQIGFENIEKGERLNVIFNYIGDRIYRLGTESRPDLIETPPIELNFVYSREFDVFQDNIMTVTFRAKNLLNEAAERTQGGLVAERYDVGRNFSLGFSFEF